MLRFLESMQFVLFVFFTAAYAYQIVYLIIGWVGKGKGGNPAREQDPRAARRADSRACRDAVQGGRSRSRDGKTDSAFTTMVLEIEQAELDRCAHKAKIILAKTGENLTYAQYRAEMEG